MTIREREWLLSEKYGGVETADFLADCLRVESGEPLAYVIGHIPFLRLSIDLASRPLIPRTETEHWVEKVLHQMGEENYTPENILDLFAGSGCIGLTALRAFPDAHVDFGDIDPRHFTSIEKSLEKNGLRAEYCRFFETDIFSGIPVGMTYDVIFANPPYLAEKNHARIQAEVLEHEPHIALFSKENGLALLEATVQNAPAFCAPCGRIYLEHDEEQGEIVLGFLRKAGFSDTETYEDQYGKPRMTCGTAP